jgi:hypothetical protein
MWQRWHYHGATCTITPDGVLMSWCRHPIKVALRTLSLVACRCRPHKGGSAMRVLLLGHQNRESIEPYARPDAAQQLPMEFVMMVQAPHKGGSALRELSPGHRASDGVGPQRWRCCVSTVIGTSNAGSTCTGLPNNSRWSDGAGTP